MAVALFWIWERSFWQETTCGCSSPSRAVRSCTKRETSSWSDARSSRSSLIATGPSGPSPSHTVPALPRPRIWWAVYRLPIFRAKTAPTDACCA
ncbi:hypothetical protein STENM327S_02030 [Streptomyces tendae]